MAQKSVIVGLPVVPYNQNKVADGCQYLQWLEDFFMKVFKAEVRYNIYFPHRKTVLTFNLSLSSF